MSDKSNRARRNSSRKHGNRRHDLLIVALLAVLAAAAALAWIAQHLAVLAVVALLVWGAYSLGRRAQGRTRPGQAGMRQVPEAPAAPLPAAAAVPVTTVPVPGIGSDWCEPGTRQQPSLQAGSDSRDKLLATPMSGARPLWGPE